MRKIIILLIFTHALSISFGQNSVLKSSACRDSKSERIGQVKQSSAIQSFVDSIHVIHYSISIDTINYVAKSIRGNAAIRVMSKVNNLDYVKLSLLKLSVDSVFVNSLPVTFGYNDTTLTIQLPLSINSGDVADVAVYYQGIPVKDASGWGGFYFSGTYAFNLGVGFAALPHNFGRVWFPCLDVFDDKSTYEFFITTPSTYKAFCNGILANEILNANGTKTWHWQMNHPIPTYLACMAVSNYYTLERSYNGIPVVWACMPADTASVLNTFQHLNPVMDAYVNAWGGYPFDKIGYNLVPFNSGAMEHASAITIGRVFINGTLNYESLWAHELSHMWWGDKVTCETAQDMWLNEGWATYNEAFVEEVLYGQQAYKNWILSNHHQMLQFAHVPAFDGSYLALNNIPDQYTYGAHVYNKAADVIHTLRNYMGDLAFFNGCKLYMNNRAYGNASSDDLRDDLTASSGINMTRFFDDWIKTPGWPHFSIDSVIHVPGAFDHYFVYTRQRSRGNPGHIYQMPVELTFSSFAGDTTVSVVIDSATNSFHIPLIGVFDWIAVDRNQKVSDAIVDYELQVTAPGNYTLNETYASINVLNAGNGNSTVRAEHNYILPDGFKQSNPGIRLSDYHYWKTDGLFSNGFHSKITFSYNGTLSANSGFLDHTLITGTEDSLVILYRPGTADDWQVVNGFTRNTGASVTDKLGSITVDTLKRGEYVFGYWDYTVGIQEQGNEKINSEFSVKPNPSSHEFVFSISPNKELQEIRIFDSRGILVFEKILQPGDYRNLKWDSHGFPPGFYTAALFCRNKKTAAIKIIKQ